MEYKLTYTMEITYLDFKKVNLINLTLEECSHYINVFTFADTREIKSIKIKKEVNI